MPKTKTFFIAGVILLIPVLTFLYALNQSAQKNYNSGIVSASMKSSGLQVKSIDTQIVSKHWQITDRELVRQHVKEIQSMGVNYVAISTPYDHPDQLKIWSEEIHNRGLNVWFRSHWLDWEGDEGHESKMTMRDYLLRTNEFIKANPSLFKENDAFTMCVEPEQVYVARKIEVSDWSSYNRFVIDQIEQSNLAFDAIGLAGKVHTNWISMNGWVVENGLQKETVDKMGVITVDHYQNQIETMPSEEFASLLESDLKKIYEKWRKPIILGEWGYNIEREVSDFEQESVVNDITKRFAKMDFIIGLNYWAHAGNSSRLISDVYGSDLTFRKAAYTLMRYYKEN